MPESPFNRPLDNQKKNGPNGSIFADSSSSPGPQTTVIDVAKVARDIQPNAAALQVLRDLGKHLCRVVGHTSIPGPTLHVQTVLCSALCCTVGLRRSVARIGDQWPVDPVRDRDTLNTAQNIQEDGRHLDGHARSHIPQQPAGSDIGITQELPICEVDLVDFFDAAGYTALEPSPAWFRPEVCLPPGKCRRHEHSRDDGGSSDLQKAAALQTKQLLGAGTLHQFHCG